MPSEPVSELAAAVAERTRRRADALNTLAQDLVLASPSTECMRQPGWLHRYQQLLHQYESAAVTVVSIRRETSCAAR